jgi:hypothetical protein
MMLIMRSAHKHAKVAFKAFKGFSLKSLSCVCVKTHVVPTLQMDHTAPMLRACQHSSLQLECHSYNELGVQQWMRTDCHLGSYRVRGGRGMGENSICVVWTQEYLCTFWCVGRRITTAPTLDSTNQPKPLSMLLLWCLTLCTFPNWKCLCERKRI